MAFYQSYHTTSGCKATHVVGVPLVTFSILIPMGWLSINLGTMHLTAAMAFVFSTLVYYFLLDRFLAILMTILMVPLTWGADTISRLPMGQSLAFFGATFVLGWAFQIIGHVIEGRKPALFDNFAQAVFTSPLFVLAESLMVLKLRKKPG